MKLNWKKIGVSALISLGGAVVAFITDFVGNTDFGVYGPIVTATGAFAVNAIKELVQSYRGK